MNGASEHTEIRVRIEKLLPFVLLALCALFILPLLLVPQYDLMDDPLFIWQNSYISGMMKTSDAWIAFSSMNYADRMITQLFHWVVQYGRYLLIGLNPLANRVAVGIDLALCTLLLYELARTLTGSRRTAFLAGLFFVGFQPHLENWMFLTPSEFTITPLMILYVLVVAKAVKAENHVMRGGLAVLSFVLIPTIYSSKEIGIITVFLSLLLWFLVSKANREDQEGSLRMVIGVNIAINVVCAASILLWRQYVLSHGLVTAYGSLYRFDLKQMIWNSAKYVDILLNGYNIVVFLLMGTYLARLLRRKGMGEDLDRFEFFGLAWFLLIVLFMLPWHTAVGRYLTPGMAGLALMMAIEVEWIMSRSREIDTATNSEGAVGRNSKGATWLVTSILLLTYATLGTLPRFASLSAGVYGFLALLLGCSLISAVLLWWRAAQAGVAFRYISRRSVRYLLIGSLLLGVLGSCVRQYHHFQFRNNFTRMAHEMLAYVTRVGGADSMIYVYDPTHVMTPPLKSFLIDFYSRPDINMHELDLSSTALRTRDLVVFLRTIGRGHSSQWSPEYGMNSLEIIGSHFGSTIAFEKRFSETVNSFAFNPDAPFVNLALGLGIRIAPSIMPSHVESYAFIQESPQMADWEVYRARSSSSLPGENGGSVEMSPQIESGTK